MDDLVAKLETARGAAPRKLIWTDGIFSMEGAIAKLPDILEIARRFGATVVLDDSHATGVLGRDRTRHGGALRMCSARVDVITSTLGKALGGASGGFVAGPAAPVCDMLTQRSRPQLFSNALPPTVAASALGRGRIRRSATRSACASCRTTARYFREQITEAGFSPIPGETPIVPIIVGETATAIRMSELLLDEGIFVTGFGYPVVPQGVARVRCQLSAGHSRDDMIEPAPSNE